MAILSAQAKLYNAFKCLVVDKNATATITSTATVSCSIGKAPFIRAGIRTAASVTAQGGFSIYGGVAKGANTLQTTATLRCKFPTYVKLDWDKLGMPEGTNVVLQMEEGFVLEGNYAETNNSPLPKNLNLFSFRTPKLYKSALASQSTLTNLTTRIKQLASSVVSAASVMAKITYNPGRFASLEMSNFNVVPTVVKTVRGAAGIVSAFTFPIGNFRLRLASSNFVQDVATLVSDNIRVRFATATMSSSSALTADVIRDIGPVVTITASAATMNVTAVKTTSAVSTISTVTSQSTTAIKTLGLIQNMSAQFSMSPTGSIPMVLEVARRPGFDNNGFNVYLPIISGAANCVIEWGDGTSTTVTSTNNYWITHTYNSTGTFTITISGYVEKFGAASYQQAGGANWPSFLIGYNPLGNHLTRVLSFGDLGTTSFATFLSDCPRLTSVPTRLPSTVTDLSGMFRFTQAGDQLPSHNISNIQYWNTVNVTKMIGMFYRVREGFNVPIGNWNTSNVTTMAYMFQFTTAFNANISSWNTSNVTQMNSMFESATAFNAPIGSWDVGNVSNFFYFLAFASAFNQDLGNWDVTGITRREDMGAMLYGINGNNPYLFDLSDWCVTNVTSEPNDFIHSMPNALRPVWGTCP